MKPPAELLRTIVALLLASAAVLLVAALSRVPYTAHGDPDALLRLSWRIQGNAVEACRALGSGEMEDLPVHMRNPDACQRRGLAHRLRVRVDDRLLVERVVEPSGARGDRPVYVFDEVALSPGRHELEVTFVPVEEPGTAGGGELPEAAGDELRFGGTIEVEAGDVVLVTLEADGTGGDRLVVRTSLP